MSVELMWKRLGVVLAYPLLIVIDILIAYSTDLTYWECHKETLLKMKEIWEGRTP